MELRPSCVADRNAGHAEHHPDRETDRERPGGDEQNSKHSPPLPSALLLPTALQRTRSASGEPTSHCPGPYAGQNRVDFFARRHTFVRRHAPSPTPMIVAVALTMNVVFELINKEFLFRNYVLE